LFALVWRRSVDCERTPGSNFETKTVCQRGNDDQWTLTLFAVASTRIAVFAAAAGQTHRHESALAHCGAGVCTGREAPFLQSEDWVARSCERSGKEKVRVFSVLTGLLRTNPHNSTYMILYEKFRDNKIGNMGTQGFTVETKKLL
jgi:hypothetical protein